VGDTTLGRQPYHVQPVGQVRKVQMDPSRRCLLFENNTPEHIHHLDHCAPVRSGDIKGNSTR